MSTSAATGAATRRPAEYGRQVVRRQSLRLLAGLAGIAAATVVLAALLGVRSGAFMFAEVIAVAAMFLLDRRLTPEIDRRIRGNDGERHVGAILDGLADEGWRTLHDVDLGRGNVDHVLIGPGGVITVETKSHAGWRRVDHLDRRWLAQAYAQRKQLERLIGGKVDCLLVFSRTHLDRPVSRQRGVLVLPARNLAGHLERRSPVLTPQQVDELHARLCASLDG